MVSWTEQTWSDSDIQFQLEGCKKNREIYEKIARNAVQCRDKIKGEYRKIKDHSNETGNNKKHWRFYDAMNKVLEA